MPTERLYIIYILRSVLYIYQYTLWKNIICVSYVTVNTVLKLIALCLTQFMMCIVYSNLLIFRVSLFADCNFKCICICILYVFIFVFYTLWIHNLYYINTLYYWNYCFVIWNYKIIYNIESVEFTTVTHLIIVLLLYLIWFCLIRTLLLFHSNCFHSTSIDEQSISKILNVFILEIFLL